MIHLYTFELCRNPLSWIIHQNPLPSVLHNLWVMTILFIWGMGQNLFLLYSENNHPAIVGYRMGIPGFLNHSHINLITQIPYQQMIDIQN